MDERARTYITRNFANHSHGLVCNTSILINVDRNMTELMVYDMSPAAGTQAPYIDFGEVSLYGPRSDGTACSDHKKALSKQRRNESEVCSPAGVGRLNDGNAITLLGVNISNEQSAFGHNVDGQVTGDEWSDIEPVRGRFSNLYLDFDGTSIHMLNDWIFSDNRTVAPQCYSVLDVWSGVPNGTGSIDTWQFKVFGDGQ